MSVKTQHEEESALYFVTLTCFNWLSLFKITESFDAVYRWFNYLHDKLRIETVSYVIMPNHLHAIFYFSEEGNSINKMVSNGKRFMAYEIVKRLKELQPSLLVELERAVSERERKKGQLHKVFNDSFDAKDIHSEKFLLQKLNYIHHNPVSGKWNLADEFTSYEHSSASFYELGKWKHYKPFDYRKI
jgi:REP element-mobilizing transposase RayT